MKEIYNFKYIIYLVAKYHILLEDLLYLKLIPENIVATFYLTIKILLLK